jgi:hypothetical protein
VRDPRCPLCDERVDSDERLRAHLSSVHDLEDDPGTTTQVETLDMFVPIPTAAELADAAAAPHVPSQRVYDPAADDERWRPIVIGVGGILLLVVAAIAVFLGL